MSDPAKAKANAIFFYKASARYGNDGNFTIQTHLIDEIIFSHLYPQSSEYS
jgi:hypothetical protein